MSADLAFEVFIRRLSPTHSKSWRNDDAKMGLVSLHQEWLAEESNPPCGSREIVTQDLERNGHHDLCWYVAELQRAPKEQKKRKHKTKKEVIGMVALGKQNDVSGQNRSMLMCSFYVASQWRCCGLGQQLMAAVIKDNSEEKLYTSSETAYVSDLCAKMGFREIDRQSIGRPEDWSLAMFDPPSPFIFLCRRSIGEIVGRN